MKTETTIDFYGKPKQIESYCVAISFFRPTGAAQCYVNGFPIEEGQSFDIAQNVGDIDVSKYQITFDDPTDVTNIVYVTRIIPVDNG